MTITTTLMPPSRGGAPATFSADMDAFLAALPTWTTQANALESNVNAKEASATSAATTATTKAGEAATSASNAASSASTAATNATTASTQASNASSSATNAAASATNAANSASAAAASAASITWTSPGAIGSTTPNSGAFTTLSATGNATLGDAEATDTHAIKGATTILANSASPALKVTQTGAGNAFVVEDTTSTDVSPFVINAAGYVVAGHTGTAISGAQLQTVSSAAEGLGAVNISADTNGPVNTFAKARGTAGAPTVVLSGDTFSRLDFSGHDGTGYIVGARITAVVDGTPGTNDMPGRLVFSTTADGASVPTERMRIDSSGNVGVGGSPFASTKFRLTGTHTSSVASPIQTYSDPTFPATGITQPTNFYSTPSTASNAGVGYTVAMLVHYLASQGTIHADSTVTVQSGFRVDGTLTGATTNYGFHSALAASGAARYNFYAAGDAPNRFVGETLVIGPAGLGYGTGAGGTVTQATSRTTTVTLNKPTGRIDVISGAGSATWTTFQVNNSLVTAADVIVLSVKTGSTNVYLANVTAVANGSFNISFATTGGTATDTFSINFAVIKGATS